MYSISSSGGYIRSTHATQINRQMFHLLLFLLLDISSFLFIVVAGSVVLQRKREKVTLKGRHKSYSLILHFSTFPKGEGDG
jgi:hypothetical protein